MTLLTGRLIFRIRLAFRKQVIPTPVANLASAPLFTYPGERYFRWGEENAYVTCARYMFMQCGMADLYRDSTFKGWSNIDIRACERFQRTFGWCIKRSDGVLDSKTWGLLARCWVNNFRLPKIHYLPLHPNTTTAVFPNTRPLSYPGRSAFGPGHDNAWVLMLRIGLLCYGYGSRPRAPFCKNLLNREASSWDDQLRESCKEFQRALGWRGRAANGYPCELTWRLLWNCPSSCSS